MSNDKAVNEAIEAKNEIESDPPKEMAKETIIERPFWTFSEAEEAGGTALENNAAKGNTFMERRKIGDRRIAQVPDGRARELEKNNAILAARIKELELDRVKRETEEALEHLEELRDASKESRGIIQIVESLERQLDDSFALRDALAADLEAARARLSKELVARRECEERLKLRDAEAALLEPLRDELSFIERERNDIERQLKIKTETLERTIEERNALAERVSAAQNRIAEVEGIKSGLDTQVFNFENRIHELGEAGRELQQRNAQCEELTRRLRDTTVQLEATETSKKALELDLATSKKIGVELREEAKLLTQKLANIEAEALDLREQLDELQVENVDLLARTKRLEQEQKAQIAKDKALAAELETTQKALRDIRAATTRAGKRMESRYNALRKKPGAEETSARVEE